VGSSGHLLGHWIYRFECHVGHYFCASSCKGGIMQVESRVYNWYYVYWTVHHLDSWVKRDQLDVTCFIISLFNAQHVLDVNTYILRSLRLIRWVISWVVLLWFDVCWCYVVVCVWCLWILCLLDRTSSW